MPEKNQSEPVRDEASLERLRKLREKLLSDDISTARKAAYNLAWLQEDGLALLKEALFGEYPRTAKKAAGYGLRNMKGRMKKMAMEVLQQGLTHRDRTTQAVSEKTIELLKGGKSVKKKPSGPPKKQPPHGNRKIQDLPARNGNVRKPNTRRPSPRR